MCARELLKTKCVCICVLEVRSGGGRRRRRREDLDGWTHSSFQHPSCAIGPKPAGSIPLFLPSGPVRFVDDWISAGLNQAVALLNLAWPSPLLGTWPKACFSSPFLCPWIFHVCAYVGGTLAVIYSLLCHCRKMSFVALSCTFLCVPGHFSLGDCKVLQKLNGSLCCSKCWRGKPSAICAHLCFRHGSGGNCCSHLL